MDGISLIENAADRATHIEGTGLDEILDQKPELLNSAREELLMLAVSNLDMLIVDKIGKKISRIGMDINVIG